MTTDTTEDRIRLAEAMELDEYRVTCENYDDEYFNPFQDANDLNAVRMWILERGWIIEEKWVPVTKYSAGGYWLEIWHPDSEIHHRQDCDYDIWMKWFCVTALKVIDNE